MHALFGYRRFINTALDESTEYSAVVHQSLLQHCRDFITLGHDVVKENVFTFRHREARLQLFESGGIDAHWLVGKDIETCLQTSGDVIDFLPVIAGDYDHV